MQMDAEWTDDEDVQGEFDPFEDDDEEAQETGEGDSDEDSDDDDGGDVLDASQIEDFSDLIAAEREAEREEAAAAAAAGQGDEARIQGMPPPSETLRARTRG